MRFFARFFFLAFIIYAALLIYEFRLPHIVHTKDTRQQAEQPLVTRYIHILSPCPFLSTNAAIFRCRGSSSTVATMVVNIRYGKEFI